MDLQTIPNLHDYLLKAAVKPLDADSEPHEYEERACAENFLLDKRPPPEALDLYKPHFASGPVSDFDDWYARHHGFALEQLFLDPGESDVPVTFHPVNHRNRVTRIDERLNLIRVERADWPCSLRGDSFERCPPGKREARGG